MALNGNHTHDRSNERIESTFKAPWGATIKTLVVLFFIAIALSAWHDKIAWLSALLVGMLVALIFSIRRYRITERALNIDHPGWSTEWNLDQLENITEDSSAMDQSFRLLSTGLFAFVGFSYNPRLRWHRVYATDPSRSVILRFTGNRSVIVTPENPAVFVKTVRSLLDKRR